MRLSAIWYDVGYDLQSLNMAVCDLCLAKLFFFYSKEKPHSDHVFPRFNHSSIVNYVVNNRWHHILSRRSNRVDSLQNINFFCIARLTAKKTLYSCSAIPKCSKDEKSILGFSSPLNVNYIELLYNQGELLDFLWASSVSELQDLFCWGCESVEIQRGTCICLVV